ncbi:hypothetical protein BY996DRAFT_6414501 [Phakopsora pachyrhizi]|nr:hypothetical protein BY996DRAFT_6414501 [Phakopsora pachyrhizi]
MLLDFNTPVGHLPKNIHDIVYIMQPICNPPIAQQMIWANLLFELLHLVARDIIAPVKFVAQQVTTENPLSNRGAILPMEGCKANDNTIKDPAAGTFKNLDDFVDKIVHVLIAINMVQAHVKCQDNPAGPSSSIRPKRKGKASSSSIETVSSKTLQLVYKEIDFGDTWHSKVDDSRKQHLSLPKKALVNAVISELS